MNRGRGVTIQPTRGGDTVKKYAFKQSSEKTLFAVGTPAQASSLCFPTGLLQSQSLQLQEQEKRLTKKGQQIYFHKF